jgi:DNA-binding CsgD family transcriptional regulator
MNPTMRLLSKPSVPTPVLGVLDALQCGGFLLDPGARVVSLNSIAFGCLGDGLVLEGERLNATNRDTDRRLQGLIAAELTAGRATNPPQSIAVQRDNRLPLVVRPHRLDGAFDRASDPVGLLLVVIDPEQWPAPPQDMLMQTFDLTRAEAQVAIGIASGRVLAEIAVDRDIKVGTVRAHLKAVFAKTRTHSQADLTGALTRLAFLAPQPKGQMARTSMRSMQATRA